MRFVVRCAMAALLTVIALSSVAVAGTRKGTSPRLDCVPQSLLNVISDIEQKYGPVVITSTHRPGAFVSGTGRPSLHRDCRAVDFRVFRNRKAAVAFLRQDPRVQGLGLYGDGHIHIDNGPRRAAWIN